jgi:hypothetical protein
MKVLEAMQVSQRKGISLPLFECDKCIDIDGVNRLIALAIATTVAKGLPTSGQTSQENISYDSHPSRAADAGHGPSRGIRHRRLSGFKRPTLLRCLKGEYR